MWDKFLLDGFEFHQNMSANDSFQFLFHIY